MLHMVGPYAASLKAVEWLETTGRIEDVTISTLRDVRAASSHLFLSFPYPLVPFSPLP